MVRAGAAALTAVVLLGGSLGCGPSLPRAYREAHAAGDRAYSAGRFEEAARMYHQAALTADRIKDRDEMLYLEASAVGRAGLYDRARAALAALEAKNPLGERAARARFDLAMIEIEHGEPARGYRLLERVVRDYPNSGLSRRALILYVNHLDETSGLEAGLAYVRDNLAWMRQNGLGEVTMYGIANHLERLDRLSDARDMFVHCSREYPYPYGGLADDSLYRASVLDERLGQPDLAIAHLREMLRHRESSMLYGSYERPRFSQAQMRMAVLYRDALHDHAAARRELRTLFSDFKTSTLRDDALWEEAKLAAQDNDTAAACEAITLLLRELPDSRYAPCARLVCATAPSRVQSEACHAYLQRQLAPGESHSPEPSPP